MMPSGGQTAQADSSAPSSGVAVAGQLGSSVSNIAAPIIAYNNAKYNSTLLKGQAATAVTESSVAVGQILRRGAAQRGAQAAAFGGAGVGYGGSSAGALDQSAINNEMDALTTKYKGAITAFGYNAAAQANNMEANRALRSGLLSGGSTLTKLSPYFQRRGASSGQQIAPAQQQAIDANAS